jgi:O-6-methylguanine DNA methyltransferase
MSVFTHLFATPVGEMVTAVDERGAVVRLELLGAREPQRLVDELAARYGSVIRDQLRCARIVEQFNEYFARARQIFDLELDPAGTDFQCRVWSEVQKIPYGSTTTYGAIARKLDTISAARAVGAANGNNPIAILIPCHRVLGSDGSLTGYGGGLEVKASLLRLEGALPASCAQAGFDF